jgi:uncharacterized protein YdaL
MTQTQPDRLDQLESIIERIDRKLDVIANDIVTMKVSQAKTEGLLEGFNKRFDSLEIRVTAQDTRLWGFIVTLSLAVIGFLSKLAFFPKA